MVATDAQWQLIRVALEFKDLYMRYDCQVSKLDHNRIIICGGISHFKKDQELGALIFNTESEVFMPFFVASNKD